MNVLSLCDGISCGQIALRRAGIKVSKYFACEVDKNAINVTQRNFPNTIQLGTVTDLNTALLPKIDILLCGFPCQSLSVANRGGTDIYEGESALFFECIRIFNEVKPKYFIFENVSMSIENMNIISNLLHVQPIAINSKLISCQNRRRLYWTNIPNINQPKDKNILFKNHYSKIYDESLILSGKGLNKLSRPRCRVISINDDKCPTLMKSQPGKPTDAIVINLGNNVYRYPTREECEFMQTIPKGYTTCVDYFRAVELLGNAWTVDAIKHILKHIKIKKNHNFNIRQTQNTNKSKKFIKNNIREAENFESKQLLNNETIMSNIKLSKKATTIKEVSKKSATKKSKSNNIKMKGLKAPSVKKPEVPKAKFNPIAIDKKLEKKLLKKGTIKYSPLRVLITKDYSIFKKIKGNRPIIPSHVKNLIKAMCKSYLLTIVLVNEKMEVMDGQNRLDAIITLKLPVHFMIVPGYGMNEVQMLNELDKNWSSNTFMDSYCTLGFEHYITYRDFMRKYGINHHETYSLLSDSNSVGNSEIFFGGHFKVVNLPKATKIIDTIFSLEPFFSEYKDRWFIFAMVRLLRNPNFDIEHFKKKLKRLSSRLVLCANADQYLLLIEDIYNYKAKPGQRVSLRYSE